MTGKLHLITGCMFAGKSTALLRAASNVDPEHVVVVKSKRDDRYTTQSEVRTHSGISFKCVIAEELRQILSEPLYAKATHIFVDEGQFFADLSDIAKEMVEIHGKVVTVAALTGDFKMKPFTCVAEVAAAADTVEWLYAKCQHCEDVAAFSRKIDKSTDLEVGGASLYEPVCRRHFA